MREIETIRNMKSYQINQPFQLMSGIRATGLKKQNYFEYIKNSSKLNIWGNFLVHKHKLVTINIRKKFDFQIYKTYLPP